MIAAILKETIVGETRVAATPKTILELIDSGLTVYVESGAGNESCFSDQDYIEAGAQIKEDAKSTLNGANLILKVVPPTLDEIELFPNDTIFISFYQTTNETKTVLKLRDKNSIVLELDLSLVSLKDILAAFNAPKIIDYLSIDIDDYSLAPLVGFPFEEYNIKVITFEHDAYRFGSQLKTPSRKFLKEKGFKLVCKNVGSVVLEEANPVPYSLASPQEDWYVNTNWFLKKIG